MKANFMVLDADICHLANPLKLDLEFFSCTRTPLLIHDQCRVGNRLDRLQALRLVPCLD